MKTSVKILIGAAVVVVVGAIVTASVVSRDKPKGEDTYWAKAAAKDLISAVAGTGNVEPKTKVNIQSSVIGEIVKLPAKEGDRVKKGDLLVQIDPDRYRSEVDRLEATLRMSRIAVEQQQVQLENAGRILRRSQDLHRKEFLSPEALEKAELDVEVGKINLQSLKEQVSQAEAALAKARDELRKTTILSPIDGLVTQLNAEIGEMTMTGTMNNPGTVILVVSDMSEVLAEVDVDETRIVKVKPGQAARVVVDAVGELHPYTGAVTEIAGTAVQRQGQQVQVFPVKIALDQPDVRLRPGMTAKARIEADRADKAVTVPIQAVLLKPRDEVDKVLAGRKDAKPAPEPAAGGKVAADQREVLFKVVDGKAVLTPVTTGLSDETSVAILAGVADGETVVTGPYRAVKRLKDGDAIREKKDGKAGESKDSEDGKDA